jgi:hypothetical protein
VLSSWGNQLPHLDSLVQTSGDEILSVWCKGDGVDRVLVTIWTFQPLNKITTASVPNTHTLVQRSSSNKFGIWRDGHRGNTVLDAECESA